MVDHRGIVEADAWSLEALVGLERAKAVGAMGPYRDAQSLAAALAPVFDWCADLIGITDDAGRVAYLNPAARARFGQSAAPGYSVERLYPPGAWDLYYREIRPSILKSRAWRGVVPMLAAGGDVLHVSQSVTGGLGVRGDTIEWLLSIAADPEDAPQSAELPRGAFTRVESRAWLDRQLARAWGRRGDHPTTVGLIYCALTGTSGANDAEVGVPLPAAMQELANRLFAIVPSRAAVARSGDDAFVVLCEDACCERMVRDLAQRIGEELHARPVTAGRQQFLTTTQVRIGASMPESSSDDLRASLPVPVARRAVFAEGALVEVRCRSFHSWSRGFVIAGFDRRGYWLRRVSDDAVIPTAFPPDEVRLDLDEDTRVSR